MTDKDELVALFTRWRVPFTEDSEQDGRYLLIRVVAGGERFTRDKWGMPGFYTEFCFDEDGVFMAMGAWE
jgi:hypothetical protein